MVNLYWQVGQYVSRQLSVAAWGDKTVEELVVDYIQKTEPQTKGFNKRVFTVCGNFFEAYKDSAILADMWPKLNITDASEIVSPLVTQLDLTDDIRQTELAQISWTNHLIILAGTNSLTECRCNNNIDKK